MAIFRGFGEIPDISGTDIKESLTKIKNYLFLLREQLDYVLGNLGVENLNESSVDELKKVITADVEAKIVDEEERLSDLSLTAEALSLSFRDAEQHMSLLEQNVEGISLFVRDAEQHMSLLEQNVDGISLSVKDAEQNMSLLEQNVEGISLSVSDAEQRMSLLEQNVDGISLSVKDKDGNMSSVALSSGILDMENLVFQVLRDGGATVIDGGNIKTGTISAVTIEGVTISGSVFSSTSDYSSMRLDSGRVSFYDESGRIYYGGLYSNSQGWVSLSSGGGAALNIDSDSHLYLRAKLGANIYIGTATGETTSIHIGKSDSNVYINGNLYINGVAYGA